MDTLRFEWDPNKNEVNKKKHGLSFETAKEVFYDEFAILFDDPDHSIDEDRFLIIGSIKTEQICIVSHCYRDDDRIRIISARKATKAEKQVYQEGIWGENYERRIQHQRAESQKEPLCSSAEKADHH